MRSLPFISACYHPTTILSVDDDPQFLNNISVQLANEVAFRFETNPIKALQYINEEYNLGTFLRRCVLQPDEFALEHRIIDINLRNIHQEVFDANRFQQIGVVVVDYTMPGMNGIEFCRNIKDPTTKRIMLTGEAEYSIALDAFNEGVITKFILKNTPNLISHLRDMIYQLQNEYFKGYSEIIIKSLTKNYMEASSCFNDPVFGDFFKQLIQKYQIVEYYLLDAQGSYLLVDKFGTATILAVINEERRDSYIQLAEDDEASTEIVEDLKNKKRIPFFLKDSDFETAPRFWQPYMQDAFELKGNDNYYCALITNCNRYLEMQNIFSYQNYLDQL